MVEQHSVVGPPPVAAVLDDVFLALADGTRRDMLRRLTAGERTIGELAQPYDMSFEAASKHVRVLERAGLRPPAGPRPPPLLPARRHTSRRGRSVAVVLSAVLDGTLRRARPRAGEEKPPWIGRAEARPPIHDNAEETMKIVLTSVMVDDQAKALAFYTQKLGFEKKKDIPLGAYRWLTVVSPEGAHGVELLLEPTGHPAAAPFQKALFDSNTPATSFGSDNVQAEFEKLSKPRRRLPQAADADGPGDDRRLRRHLRQPHSDRTGRIKADGGQVGR